MNTKRPYLVVALIVLGGSLVYGTGKSTNMLRDLFRDPAGSATITWEAGQSATQVVERTTALTPDNANWQGIHTSLPPNQGTNTFTDSMPPDDGAFYRVRQVQ